MQSEQVPISLCLLGGGFRASFFHLGVIRYLYEAGLLQDVAQICSVSGGSILAAHLSQNWQRYTGTKEEFAECVKELTGFGRLDLRGRVVRRWLLSIIFFPVRLLRGRFWKRTLLLQRFYSRYLYKGATLKTLAKDVTERKRPEVHLLSTSLTTGFYARSPMRGFGVTTGRTSLLYVLGFSHSH